MRVGTLIEGSHLALGVWLSAASALASGPIQASHLHRALKAAGIGSGSYEGAKTALAAVRGRLAAYRPARLSGPIYLDIARVRRKRDRVAIAVEAKLHGRVRLGVVESTTGLRRFLRTVVPLPFPRVMAGPGILKMRMDGFVHRFWRGALQRTTATPVMSLDAEIAEFAKPRTALRPFVSEWEFQLTHRGREDEAIAYLLHLAAPPPLPR